MKLDLDLYQWLLKLKIIPEQSINNLYAQIDQGIQERLQNGQIISIILQNFDAKIDVEIKQGNTNGIRLFNWNNLCKALQKINISLDDDIKIQIVKGDWEMLTQFLKELKLHYESANLIEEQISATTRQDAQYTEPQELSIDEIDGDKPLKQTGSLLEFIIVSICKHFNMKPKQAVTLLQNNYKLLSNLLIKGNKGFKIIINWLMELSKYLNHINNFLEYKVDILLSLLKAGLVSQNNEVCYWSLYIIEGVVINLPQKALIEDVYAWMIREHGGLITLILSQSKHPQYLEQICKIFSIVSQYNVVDFFDVQLRKILKSGKEYIDFINGIIQTIQIRDQMQQLNLMELFSSHAVKLFEPQHSPMERMTALKFFEHYWIFYPQEFVLTQMDQYLINSRKVTRETSFTMRIFTYQSLFRILDNLALIKDKYAALLYKKLVFSLIENFDQKEIREFLVANFLMLIKRYSTIPIDILIIPMVKQLQIEQNEFQINVADFELFKAVCNHPKIDVNVAIQMLDMLSKLFLSSVIFYQMAFQQIQLLLTKFIAANAVQEFTFNLVKIAVSEYYGNYQEHIKSNPKTILNRNPDEKIIRQQFRSQIISLIKFIINLRSFELNEMIKPIIAHYYLEIQQNLKTESKALFMLLGHFGNPQEILEEAQEKEAKQNSQSNQTLQIQQNNSQKNNNKNLNLKNISQIIPNYNQSKSTKSVQQINDDPFKELRDDSKRPQLTMLGNLALNQDEQHLLKQFELL